MAITSSIATEHVLESLTYLVKKRKERSTNKNEKNNE